MSQAPKKPAAGSPASLSREAEKRRAREAEALRQNLLKRKAQKRARAATGNEPEDQPD